MTKIGMAKQFVIDSVLTTEDDIDTIRKKFDGRFAELHQEEREEIWLDALSDIPELN